MNNTTLQQAIKTQMQINDLNNKVIKAQTLIIEQQTKEIDELKREIDNLNAMIDDKEETAREMQSEMEDLYTNNMEVASL